MTCMQKWIHLGLGFPRSSLDHGCAFNSRKYQGVKEFYMLDRIVVIVKIWFSVLSNLKSHVGIHPRETNDDIYSF